MTTNLDDESEQLASVGPGTISTLLTVERGVGVTELLHASAPWAALVLFALCTQLGDVWFLFVLGGVLYVGGEYVPRFGIERREGLFVLALAIAYVSLVGVLKDVLMLPRPPGANAPPPMRWIPPVLEGPFTSVTTAEGPGFPSGHALGTTMVWGGVALVLDRGTRRTRLGVAGAVVSLVALSRLVLGVHYLVDVVTGTLLGAVALWSFYRLADGGTAPERVLLVTIVLAGLGSVVALTSDSVAAVGGAVGAWMAWEFVAEATPPHPSSRREAIASLAVAVVAGVVFGAVYVASVPHAVTFLGTALATGTAVVAPAVGNRVA